MTGDQWYFAYGSNLFIDQKEKRTGHIREAVVCRLPAYGFAFNERGKGGQIYANILPDPMAEVWGVAYLCNPKAIDAMDRYEGVTSGDYKRIPVTVEKQTGEKVEAITYVAGDGFVCEPGRPTADYRHKTAAAVNWLPTSLVATKSGPRRRGRYLAGRRRREATTVIAFEPRMAATKIGDSCKFTGQAHGTSLAIA